ncbi:rhomboid family intramembrane serine protease [Candidatus Woesearchaeota archaeon]|nr:rhomboid family intramembrane serine protease [Candidatus Woesearchaeota archaeon]
MKVKYSALWLALVCIIVFVFQLIIGNDAFVLIETLKWTEPWRLVASIFAHGSAGHLLSNLFSLCLFGLVLEGRVGARRVLWLFFAAGLFANVFTWYPRSLGASGAIFGLIGALCVLRPLMVIWLNGLPVPMILAGVAYLIQDTIGLFAPSGVANGAHIIGLFVGMGAGLLWRHEFGDRIG